MTRQFYDISAIISARLIEVKLPPSRRAARRARRQVNNNIPRDVVVYTGGHGLRCYYEEIFRRSRRMATPDFDAAARYRYIVMAAFGTKYYHDDDGGDNL